MPWYSFLWPFQKWRDDEKIQIARCFGIVIAERLHRWSDCCDKYSATDDSFDTVHGSILHSGQLGRIWLQSLSKEYKYQYEALNQRNTHKAHINRKKSMPLFRFPMVWFEPVYPILLRYGLLNFRSWRVGELEWQCIERRWWSLCSNNGPKQPLLKDEMDCRHSARLPRPLRWFRRAHMDDTSHLLEWLRELQFYWSRHQRVLLDCRPKEYGPRQPILRHFWSHGWH